MRAVAWDIDGTLVDSEPLHHEALVEASRGFGVDLSDLPAMAFRGVQMQDVWTLLKSRFPDTLEQTAWLGAIESYYVANARSLRPITGAIEAVRQVSGLGLAQACVSNSSRRIVDANLTRLGLADAMGFSISCDDVANAKPHPEPYRRALDAFGLPPEAVVAIEDSASGVRSARAAGLRVVGLGMNGARDFPIDWTIENLAQLINILAPGRGAMTRSQT